LPPAGESIRGPGRPQIAQTSQPFSSNRGAILSTAAPALAGLGSTIDSDTRAGEP
jgi:hypothetical protein